VKTRTQKASERGHATFGWLNTYHSFSFGQLYDPAKVHFRALRVNNQLLQKRGTLEITCIDEFGIKIKSDADLLAVEVSMLQ
jgi:hypothetical protein